MPVTLGGDDIHHYNSPAVSPATLYHWKNIDKEALGRLGWVQNFGHKKKGNHFRLFADGILCGLGNFF